LLLEVGLLEFEVINAVYLYHKNTIMLSKTEKSFTLIFALIVLLELVCGSIESLSQLHYFTKPLILITLIIFFVKQSNHLSSKTKTVTLLALLFSLAGDILLMFLEVSPNFFIGGLVAFLMAHIMFIIVFLTKRGNSKMPIPFTLFLIIYAIGLFYLLKDGLNEMLIPVIAYMLVILTMALAAHLRKGNAIKLSFNLVFNGALFFMISDSILAINKFYQAFEISGILIMATYAIAQYLIMLGVLRQKE
jgi:uncharacterized membrane protein YhhN